MSYKTKLRGMSGAEVAAFGVAVLLGVLVVLLFSGLMYYGIYLFTGSVSATVITAVLLITLFYYKVEPLALILNTVGCGCSVAGLLSAGVVGTVGACAIVAFILLCLALNVTKALQ